MDPNAPGQYSTPDQYIQNDNEDQGWVSWAWSFVPAIINTNEEEEYYAEMESTGNPSPLQSSLREPIVSVGFYCTKASVTFKVRDKQAFCFMLVGKLVSLGGSSVKMSQKCATLPINDMCLIHIKFYCPFIIIIGLILLVTSIFI